MSLKSSIFALSNCLAMGLIVVSPTAAISAAPDGQLTAAAAASTGIELIAFEVPGCVYCPIFRRDVVPSYAASRAGKTAPLRFVDLNDAAADSFKLSAPITIVPTLVLVRDGIELARISGYTGRENVHRLLNSFLPSE